MSIIHLPNFLPTYVLNRLPFLTLTHLLTCLYSALMHQQSLTGVFSYATTFPPDTLSAISYIHEETYIGHKIGGVVLSACCLCVEKSQRKKKKKEKTFQQKP